jgi:hypothetical protein
MKKVIITTGLILALQGGLFANTSGQLTISGTVPEIQAVQVSDTGKSDLLQIGNQEYDKVKVGEITLDSNGATGFSLAFGSATDGYLALDGSSVADNDSKISYTVSLSNATGTLGDNVSLSGQTNANPEGGEVLFTASGTATPTYERQYDIGISTSIKGLVQGTYSDVLTITIANN